MLIQVDTSRPCGFLLETKLNVCILLSAIIILQVRFTMPYLCCVPFCRGNYPNGPKVSVYSFPKNEEYKNKWIAAIQRKNFKPTSSSKVCERHFTENDFENEVSDFDSAKGTLITVPLKIKRIKKQAVPTIFSDYPKHHSKPVKVRLSPDSKKQRKENSLLEKICKTSLQEVQDTENEKKIFVLDDVRRCVSKFGISPEWIMITGSTKICFCKIMYEPAPSITHSLIVDVNLTASAFLQKTELKQVGKKYHFPLQIASFNDIENALKEFSRLTEEHTEQDLKVQLIEYILNGMTTECNERVISFIREQLSLLTCSKYNVRYSPQMLIFTCILHSISPHAYSFLRQSGNFKMPHPSTLKNVCRSLPVSPELEQHDEHFLMYVKHRFAYLKEQDHNVIMQIDEIHIKPYLDYKGGHIVGMAFDSNQTATSAYVFLISGISSTFKEVAHILPVHSINYISLHSVINKIVIGLENIGFRVTCIVSDNNAINRKAMSLFGSPPHISFVYPHPIDSSRPLFFIIDTVHLFKNIRNNWLNQKNPDKCLFFPPFHHAEKENDQTMPNFCTASFSSLRQLYDIECTSVVTYAHGLTLKALSPSNLERQNVKLVLKVFNKFVIQGLLELGEKYQIPHYRDTANFISIICTWWQIVNVKTPLKGIRNRNIYENPLTSSEDDEKLMFLNNFIDWLDAWKNMRCTTGAFSKETHDALRQSTYGLLELCRYCTDELHMQYVLPGKVQTDRLEDRFGRYRQLAGGQYNISMRQVLECEKKLRVQSIVSLELKINNQLVNINQDVEDIDHVFPESFENECNMSVIVEESDLKKGETYLPVIVYLAGYCCYSVLRRQKCISCKKNLTLDKELETSNNYRLIKSFDRGGLQYPVEGVVSIVMYTYIAIDKMCSNTMFLKVKNQRSFAVKKIVDLLQFHELQPVDGQCENGHSTELLWKKIIWVAINVILKNVCSKNNDKDKNESSSRGKKRKLRTLHV